MPRMILNHLYTKYYTEIMSRDVCCKLRPQIYRHVISYKFVVVVKKLTSSIPCFLE